MKRFLTAISVIALLVMAIPASAASDQFPGVIALPDGIAPEGIVSGSGTDFYAGSLADGTIYRGDFRTGGGEFINDAADFPSDRVAVGLDYDPRSKAVWVAGGPTGSGYVYDANTGATLAVLVLASSSPTFVNDVVVTRDTAYFTESSQAVIYSVSLDRHGLPTGDVEAVPLTGDYELFPGEFNANGIVATPNTKTLIIVNSFSGALFTVDGVSGDTVQIDLDGGDVTSGDGMLLDGKTLYVVQNFLNQISVVHLSPDFASGTVVDAITDGDFDIPTTVAEFGSSLYAVNARFTTTPGPTVEYDVVRVGK